MFTMIFFVSNDPLVPIDVQEKCISTLVGRQATIVETCLVDEKILPHLPLGNSKADQLPFMLIILCFRPYSYHIPIPKSSRRKITSYKDC